MKSEEINLHLKGFDRGVFEVAEQDLKVQPTCLHDHDRREISTVMNTTVLLEVVDAIRHLCRDSDIVGSRLRQSYLGGYPFRKVP